MMEKKEMNREEEIVEEIKKGIERIMIEGM